MPILSSTQTTQDPFADLQELRDKLEKRIQQRKEIWQIINQGEVSEGIQQANAENIKLLNEPKLSLKLLEEQKNALDEMTRFVEQKQEQIKEARKALDNINIEEKKAALTQALGMDYLQQADVALFELNIETLGSLISKLNSLNLQDEALQDWETTLQDDWRWLSAVKPTYSNPYPPSSWERATSEWEQLQSCMHSLIKEKKNLNNDQWQFLRQLNQRYPDSRLLAKYKWLAYHPKTAVDTKQTDDLQTSIRKLAEMFSKQTAVDNIEKQLDSISTQIKNTALNQTNPSATNQLTDVFLTMFLNLWADLIHDSQKIQKDLEELKGLVDRINSDQNLTLCVRQIGRLVENTNDIAFFPQADTCIDILGKIGNKNATYPNTERFKYIQGLREKAEDKQEQGKKRFERIWLTKNETFGGRSNVQP